MPDRTEELRARVRQTIQAEAEQSKRFERIAKRFYSIELNRTILTWEKARHAVVFGFPPGLAAADFVVEDTEFNGERSLIIAEAKGSAATNIDHAIQQLESLGRFIWRHRVRLRVTQMMFHLLLPEGLNPDSLVTTMQGPKFKARKTNKSLGRRTVYRLERGEQWNLIAM